MRRYAPLSDDPPNVLRAKAMRRQIAIEGLAGGAFTVEDETKRMAEVDAYVDQKIREMGIADAEAESALPEPSAPGSAAAAPAPDAAGTATAPAAPDAPVPVGEPEGLADIAAAMNRPEDVPQELWDVMDVEERIAVLSPDAAAPVPAAPAAVVPAPPAAVPAGPRAALPDPVAVLAAVRAAMPSAALASLPASVPAPAAAPARVPVPLPPPGYSGGTGTLGLPPMVGGPNTEYSAGTGTLGLPPTLNHVPIKPPAMAQAVWDRMSYQEKMATQL